MALTTDVNINLNGDPIIANFIDTGTASAPVDRPTTFTPPSGYPTLTPSVDYGVATPPAKRPQVFEPISYTATLDPGATVSG